MSKKQRILPQWIAAKNLYPGWEFSGLFPISERIRGWADAEWPESFPLSLTVEQAQARSLSLHIQMQISATLRCERCREPMPWALDLEQTVQLVSAEDDDEAMAQWLIHDDRLALHDLLESEISLALPDFPRHPNC